MIHLGLNHFLIVAALLFGCGVATLLIRRNALGILMGVELMLNAANINLVAFNRYCAGAQLDGQVLAAFIIVIAAAEAAVALAIFLNFYSRFASIDVEQARRLEH